MKRNWKIWLSPFFGALLVLCACFGQLSMKEKEVGAANLDFHDKTVNNKGNGHVHGDKYNQTIEGIPEIKVILLDDTIILARAKAETTSTNYDEMQKKVLSNTAGASGKGDLDGVDQTKVNTDDNLDKAKDMMSKAFNGQVQILTVTNPEAMPLIDGIKANIKSATPSYSKLSSDINTLIKMTREK